VRDRLPEGESLQVSQREIEDYAELFENRARKSLLSSAPEFLSDQERINNDNLLQLFVSRLWLNFLFVRMVNEHGTGIFIDEIRIIVIYRYIGNADLNTKEFENLYLNLKKLF
jgi:hypothetical protein